MGPSWQFTGNSPATEKCWKVLVNYTSRIRTHISQYPMSQVIYENNWLEVSPWIFEYSLLWAKLNKLRELVASKTPWILSRNMQTAFRRSDVKYLRGITVVWYCIDDSLSMSTYPLWIFHWLLGMLCDIYMYQHQPIFLQSGIVEF